MQKYYISLSITCLCVSSDRVPYLTQTQVVSAFIMSSTGARNSNEGLLYNEDKAISDDYFPLNNRFTKTPWYGRPLPWILMTVFFLITNSISLAYSATAWHYYKPSQFGNFETGFTTDLGEFSYEAPTLPDQSYNFTRL